MRLDYIFKLTKGGVCHKKIFNIGDIITHDSTGMIGEIVRKGANHLICVTEDDKMFKTWTQDVSYDKVAGKSTPKQTRSWNGHLEFLQRLLLG